MEEHPTITLPARQLFEIADAAGVRILCTAGSLWLTLDHDPRDIVLQAGDAFESDAQRRLLLYAFERSTFAVHARVPRDRRPQDAPAPRLWAARLAVG